MSTLTNSYNTESNKSSSLKKLHFYGDNYAHVNIDPEIIRRLHLTCDDSVIEEITNDGNILLRRVQRV